LDSYDIKSNADFKAWAKINHPDKGGEHNTFATVSAAAEKAYPKHGTGAGHLKPGRLVKGGMRETGWKGEAKESVENGIPQSRADLPTTREGYVALAQTMREAGHSIRVNSGSALENIRLNFIRKLKL